MSCVKMVFDERLEILSIPDDFLMVKKYSTDMSICLRICSPAVKLNLFVEVVSAIIARHLFSAIVLSHGNN